MSRVLAEYTTTLIVSLQSLKTLLHCKTESSFQVTIRFAFAAETHLELQCSKLNWAKLHAVQLKISCT